MLTNIHIWICLVFKKSQGLPVNAVEYSHLQNNNYWFVNRVYTTLGSRGYFFLMDTDGSRRSRVNEAQSAEEKKIFKNFFKFFFLLAAFFCFNAASLSIRKKILWNPGQVYTRSNDTVLNSVGLMILNNSNFKFTNNGLLFSKFDWTQEIQRKVTFVFAKRMSFIQKSFIDEQ